MPDTPSGRERLLGVFRWCSIAGFDFVIAGGFHLLLPQVIALADGIGAVILCKDDGAGNGNGGGLIDNHLAAFFAKAEMASMTLSGSGKVCPMMTSTL